MNFLGENESYTDSLSASHDIEEDSEHLDATLALFEEDVTSLTAPLLSKNSTAVSIHKTKE